MFFKLFQKLRQQTAAAVVNTDLQDNSLAPNPFGAAPQQVVNTPVQTQTVDSVTYKGSNVEIPESSMDEKRALEELLAYENKISTSRIPLQNVHQAEDSTNLANERSEITRARQALRIRNPFRGV